MLKCSRCGANLSSAYDPDDRRNYQGWLWWTRRSARAAVDVGVHCVMCHRVFDRDRIEANHAVETVNSADMIAMSDIPLERVTGRNAVWRLNDISETMDWTPQQFRVLTRIFCELSKLRAPEVKV